MLLIIVSSAGIFDMVPSDNQWRIMPRVKTKLSLEPPACLSPMRFPLQAIRTDTAEYKGTEINEVFRTSTFSLGDELDCFK